MCVTVCSSCNEMKTVLILAGFIALVKGGALPHENLKTKYVEEPFIERQKQILALFEHSEQLDIHSEYYQLGKYYNIEANIDNYSNKDAVKEFLILFKAGFLPKYHKFSVFYERMRNEAVAMFYMMYYANDFDTFYKTASWAKIHMNEEQFLYACYIAVVQRGDTTGIILPAPYEIYPQFFFNKEVLLRMYRTKMQGGVFNGEAAAYYGIVKENHSYVYYANYSNGLTYPNQEQKLSYFTEDIGLNSYYYYFHTHMPFWWKIEKLSILKNRTGEFFFYYYQQLLARYYLERLTNGLGEIPEFSWYSKFETGYYPQLTGNFLPFAQRSNDYEIHNENTYDYIRFLDAYEKTFSQFLQKAEFKSPEKQLNFIGNYWHTNSNLNDEKINKDLHQYSYEIIARHVLGASPKPVAKYDFLPTALDFYQTSLRDPAFYQLYQRIINYLIEYKEYLDPYEYNDLHFEGVKINDVKISELVTYFDYFDFNATSGVYFSQDELISYPTTYVIRQPRLNQKPFTIKVEVTSTVETDAAFKIFIGPKYDPTGYPTNIEESWTRFCELDWFVYKLVIGENKVERNSSEFLFFKDDSIPIKEIYQWLDQGKVPYDMSVQPDNIPRRLMLPKGTPGGFSLQLFVFIYPYNNQTGDNPFQNYILENKPFGYPFDRPVRETYYGQPNMFYEEVQIYHKGPYFSYELNVPTYFQSRPIQ
ncbi:arylphorin subunit alpha-like [Spodoptera litura]|uniref:Arylphorin subunit alpha-like n=1 Tax=Spodoptera litura TaxID=69820 RepID=A0A9J7E6R5_SPOLT|nr:arylphorin subunit alpha-like [Spodoptera litura]